MCFLGRKKNIILLSRERFRCSNKKHRAQRSNNQIYRVCITIISFYKEYFYKDHYRSFNPGQPCDYCHTHKTRQIYYQPEPNFWMVMVYTLD